MDQGSDLDKRTEQYVLLRDTIDKIKERHKEELAPYEDVKKKFEAFFLETLDTLGVTSVKGPHGTVYKRIEASATIADGSAFREYVVSNELFELADIRANKTAVREFVENKGIAPPGVNYSTSYAVGCRRGNKE
jgi:hypothetical protein